MTKPRLVAAIVALAGAYAMAGAAADWQFKTLQAKRAVSIYQKETEKVRVAYERDLAELDATFRANMTKLRRELASSLEVAKQSAMANQNLEEAVRIDEAIKQLKRQGVPVADTSTPEPKPEQKAEGFEILEARYGNGYGWIDVTARIKGDVKDGQLMITRSGKQAGWPDPAPNRRKSILVMYRHDGDVKLRVITDGAKLSLP